MAVGRPSTRRRLLALLARMHIVAAFVTSGWIPFHGVRCASFKRSYVSSDENQVIKVSDTADNPETVYYDRIGSIPSDVPDRQGEPTESSSCDVIRSLAEDSRRLLGAGTATAFYEKYTEAYGIPVVGSSQVDDAALSRACYVLRFLLADRADLRRAYYKAHGRVVVVGQLQTLHDVPEYQRVGVDTLSFPADGPTPVRGLAAIAALPVSSAPEENLLCRDSASTTRDTFDDVLLKTLAVGLLNVAAERGFSRPSLPGDETGGDGAPVAGTEGRRGLKEELDLIYEHAMRSGWWQRTNAARSADSYFGEGVQSYFNANAYANPPDGFHNDINTRTKLRHYDTWLYAFIQNMFPCANNYIKRCNSRGNEAYQQLPMNCPESGWYYTNYRHPD